MELAGWLTTVLVIAEALVRAGLALRVLMRRLPVAVTTSWLGLILFVPIVGVVAYLLVGESRIGRRRLERERAVQPAYTEYLERLRTETEHLPGTLSRVDRRFAQEAESVGGFPALAGNRVVLLDGAGEFFDAMVRMIDAAERSVMLEFFIWHSAGRVEEVEEALLRAVGRGVACRVLVDAVGSRGFVRSVRYQELRCAGIQLAAALPPQLLRTPLIRRVDHRNHRKLAVVDESRALMGSINMVDPLFFKSGSGVGEWIDLMVEVRGPAVELLALLAIRDWETEAGEDLCRMREALYERELTVAGVMAVQAVASGPGCPGGGIQALVLSAIYAAEKRLTITTPYFVPDPAVVTALQSAARRGVEVTVIVPARCDTVLTHFAGRAFFTDLLEAGVRIAEFRGGLLHTKSIVVDNETALFGTVNLDPRSFWLNFELTLMIYDNDSTGEIFAKQQSYLEQCRFVDLETWKQRPMLHRVVSNIAQLFAPIL
ncbi:MAG: cardiolipin synthase [Planctomycetota bacterium]|nr:cardiolipin synthase [Planctomycetota bacterium]